MEKHGQEKSFVCWVSGTCFVCRNGWKPTLHVRNCYKPISPCDTTSIVIKAENRGKAGRIARKHFAKFL